MECIFCKIINKEISSNFIFEDEDIIVINDLHPKSRIHMLIIPKKHIPTISELEDLDQNLIGKIFLVTRNLAKQNNINWYKLIFNVWKDGWQEVMHIHLHFLAN